MKEYDVIVVGAGPAGCAAANAASRQGASVIMIEEHPIIGVPRHCPGRLHSSSFTREILKDLDPRVIVCEYRSRRYFAPSGKVIKETPLPPDSVYQVQRDEFDRELARQAALAGTKIVLSTRVTGLYKAPNLIARFNSDGLTIRDIYNNNLVVTNSLRLGNIYYATYFDGVNDYVLIPNSATLSFVDNFSLNLWFNHAMLKEQILLAKSGDRTGLGIKCHVTGSIGIENGRCCPVHSFDSGVVDTLQWHMITVSYGSGVIKPYLAGVFQNSETTASFNLNPAMTNQPVYLGMGPSGYYYYKAGPLLTAGMWLWP